MFLSWLLISAGIRLEYVNKIGVNYHQNLTLCISLWTPFCFPNVLSFTSSSRN